MVRTSRCVVRLHCAGLFRFVEFRRINRHDEAIYDVVAERIELQHDYDDATMVKLISRLVNSLLRVAGRDVARALENGRARVTGRERNLHTGRSVVWLSKADLREVNDHVASIVEVFERTRSDQSGK